MRLGESSRFRACALWHISFPLDPPCPTPSSPLAPQRILVTGAAGFIASRVCALLHEQGREVIGLDNFNDAYDVRLKVWRWVQLENLPGLELHRLDLTDTDALERLFEKHARADQGAPFDAVINLAARAGVRPRWKIPRVYVEANVTGALNVLEMCRKFGVKKFVLASTSSLYGKDHRDALSRGDEHRPPAFALRGDEEGGRGDGLHLPLPARARRQRAALLHGLRAGGPARHDAAALRAADPRGADDHDFRRRHAVARFHLRRRHRARDDLGAAAGGLRGVQPRLRRAAEAERDDRADRGADGHKAKIEYKPWHPADMAATWADITKARKYLDWAPQTTSARACRSS